VAPHVTLRALDEWLDELFPPERAATTAQEFVPASTQDIDRNGQIEAARRRIASARRELERCRSALRDARSDAAQREVLTWLEEAAAEKEVGEAALKTALELSPPTLSVDEVLAIVERCGGLTGVLREATDAERATLYNSLGVSAVYNAESNEVRLGVDPVALAVCRRGGLSTSATRFP